MHVSYFPNAQMVSVAVVVHALIVAVDNLAGLVEVRLLPIPSMEVAVPSDSYGCRNIGDFITMIASYECL